MAKAGADPLVNGWAEVIQTDWSAQTLHALQPDCNIGECANYKTRQKGKQVRKVFVDGCSIEQCNTLGTCRDAKTELEKDACKECLNNVKQKQECSDRYQMKQCPGNSTLAYYTDGKVATAYSACNERCQVLAAATQVSKELESHVRAALAKLRFGIGREQIAHGTKRG